MVCVCFLPIFSLYGCNDMNIDFYPFIYLACKKGTHAEATFQI